MFIYFISVYVSLELVDEWLKWMKDTHIPNVMKTNIFISANINRVISKSDTGITYAIAYKCQTLKDLQRYEITFARKIRNEYNLKYAQSAPTFRTIMEILDEF